MTRAYIPDRDLPNFQGKQRDVAKAMILLRERVAVGAFLDTRPEVPDEAAQVGHQNQHAVTGGWARVHKHPWCGICMLGIDVWSRYEAGLIQPIEPTDDVPEPVEVKYSPLKQLPSLPVEGYIRAAEQREKSKP